MDSYRWTAPKATEGEKWWFYDHPRNGVEGNFLLGTVMLVQTSYDQSGDAYHVFHMAVPAYVRRRVVGEESLRGLEPA